MTQSSARRLRWGLLGAGFAVALAAILGLCEALGWPFLVAPAARSIGTMLDRRVSLQGDPAAAPGVAIHLLGHIRITAGDIEIGAPPWSAAPQMLHARNARMTLDYADVWRASRGAPLRIRELRAEQLDAQIERLADGRATWQFGKATNTPDTGEPLAHVPVFRRLQVDAVRWSFATRWRPSIWTARSRSSRVRAARRPARLRRRRGPGCSSMRAASIESCR